MTNLYHRSTLQIIRQSSGGLVLPKSGIKPFLTGGLNEKTIFRPRLLDYLPDPQEKKARPSEGNLLGITSFAPAGFAIVLLYFSRQQNIQTYKGIIVIITYFLFIGKYIAGGGSGNLHRFQYKTSLAI